MNLFPCGLSAHCNYYIQRVPNYRRDTRWRFYSLVVVLFCCALCYKFYHKFYHGFVELIIRQKKKKKHQLIVPARILSFESASLFKNILFTFCPKERLDFSCTHFRFILAPFFLWSISFPDFLDLYKASDGSTCSYFNSLAFAICELCKRLVVPWALSHVRYGIDQKPSRYSRSARFRCNWFLDNKNSVIGELCAYHVGLVPRWYIFKTFKSGTMVFICVLLKWKCNWKEHA